jgi:hypothetical protein
MALGRPTTREHACTLGDSSQNSYVQFEVFEQDPIEPLFRGNIVMLFSAKDVPTGTKQVSLGTGAGNGYFGNLDEISRAVEDEARAYTEGATVSVFSKEGVFQQPRDFAPTIVFVAS